MISCRTSDHIVRFLVLYGRVRRGGGRWGGVGKIVKYGGMSNDRSSDKKSHKVRFEQALFKQIGPQLLYGLPVPKRDFLESPLAPSAWIKTCLGMHIVDDTNEDCFVSLFFYPIPCAIVLGNYFGVWRYEDPFLWHFALVFLVGRSNKWSMQWQSERKANDCECLNRTT